MSSTLKFCSLSRISHLPYSIKYNSNCVSRISQTDPILSLYTQKLREFRRDKEASSGDMVGINQEQKVRHDKEVDRLKKMFGGDKLEMFPQFNFE